MSIKNYPRSVPRSIPPIKTDINSLFFSACEEFQNRTAFRSFDREMSFSELKRLSLLLAAGLQSRGLQKGDRIIIQLPNILQYPVSLWASFLSGLVAVNMNPFYSSKEMLRQINDSGAKAMVLLSSAADRLQNIISQTGLKTVIVTEPGDLLGFPKKQAVNFWFKRIQKQSRARVLKTALSFSEILKAGFNRQAATCKIDLDETLCIQYTSGVTAGDSKGAALSQRNILSNVKQCELWFAPSLKRGGERALAPLPLYHSFAFLVNGLALFFYGAENILIADPRRTSDLIKTMKKHPVSTGAGVNTLFKALLQHSEFKTLDFSSFKFFIAGGAALEASVQKQWQSVTASPLIEGYGLTEASPVVCCGSLQNPRESEGTAGFPLPSTEIRIVDDTGRPLPDGEQGELEVRGPQVMQGYYNNLEETEKAFNKGWLRTGDIALINEKSLLVVKDRKKDLINVSGFNVFPREVEEALCLHEFVTAAAALGVKDDFSGQAVKAFVVTNKPSLTKKELTDHCRKHLAPFKIPKYIEFANQIPQTPAGKPLRRALRS